LDKMAATPALAWGFLAVRFFGLVAVVPLIEEFFLRGFVMRFVIQADWWAVPFGKVNRMALVLGTLVPMAMHPGELLAAAVWFSMITWLMVRTRNIWDCVIAHAITTLLLGIYVVWSGHWELMKGKRNRLFREDHPPLARNCLLGSQRVITRGFP
jgi:CAAX prenyl protease-like protein